MRDTAHIVVIVICVLVNYHHLNYAHRFAKCVPESNAIITLSEESYFSFLD